MRYLLTGIDAEHNMLYRLVTIVDFENDRKVCK